MASSRQLISSQTLGSTAATVTFSSIPGTFTDLVLKWSVRDTNPGTGANYLVTINSDITNNSDTYLRGNGSAASSNFATAQVGLFGGFNNGDTSTANVYSNGEMYIPNYAASAKKPISAFGVNEDNASFASIYAVANLNSGTAAVTSLTLKASVLFMTYSSFYLYGIKNS